MLVHGLSFAKTIQELQYVQSKLTSMYKNLYLQNLFTFSSETAIFTHVHCIKDTLQE